MPIFDSKKIDEAIAQLEQSLEAAKSLRAAIQNPVSAKMLLDLLTSARLEGMRLRSEIDLVPRQPKPGTQAYAVVEFLRAGGNDTRTTPEIVKGTSLSRGAVGAILHSHKEWFEKLDVPGNAKLKAWRLRNGCA